MTLKEWEIAMYLKRCIGKENAKHYKTIARVFELSERQVRRIVSMLVTKKHLPIATTSDAGYYWIQTDDEFKHAHNELISRVKKLTQRARGLRKGYYDMAGQQLQLI